MCFGTVPTIAKNADAFVILISLRKFCWPDFRGQGAALLIVRLQLRTQFQSTWRAPPIPLASTAEAVRDGMRLGSASDDQLTRATANRRHSRAVRLQKGVATGGGCCCQDKREAAIYFRILYVGLMHDM